MNYLDQDTIYKIHTETLQTPGLVQRRNQLLAGMAIEYTTGLTVVTDQSTQLLNDLNSMNMVRDIKGGVVPLERWLRNAAYLSNAFPAKQRFFRELADEVAKKRVTAQETEAGIETVPGIDSLLGNILEKVIFVNDMVPFGFLTGAQQIGQSIARLIVPRFEGGNPKNYPFSDEQMEYYGTGWLIGERHIITNHHVVNARDPGEQNAAADDLHKQGAATTVQFDYNHRGDIGDQRFVAKLCTANINLDFAILELQEGSGRKPLPLWGDEFELPEGSYVPVNIIQHPGGAPKQLGIRNNLITELRDNDLAYFTDTENGSSGSPVCTDQWHVIGLHKASTQSFGKLEFQGKTTSWVNIGTRIDRIIADLQEKHQNLWAEIGPSMLGVSAH